jgi:coenzyme F420-reducing hydrogenase alpha subunit
VTHRPGERRRLETGALARVEGEGALTVHLHVGMVEAVDLRIYEPPRFFEGLLRGRAYTEPPDITARICGICPVAYQMSACAAVEQACGVTVGGALRDLRRLLYCGEWIESHALHIFLLHAPDFLGYESGIAMAADHREWVERGLQLKKVGNEIVALIGGRAIHPINVRVGGFHRVPTARELEPLAERVAWARDAAAATVDWVSGFDMPELEIDCELLALRHPTEYAILDGRLATTGGVDADVAEFERLVVEEHVPHSTALHARLDGATYLTGAIARFALNRERLRPLALDAAAAHLSTQVANPFRTIVIRAVEILHACEEALAVIEAYRMPADPAVPVPPRAGVGHGASEAPRGLLYHRYEIDDEGLIAAARIVPPTSQNQAQIEDDLRRFVAPRLDLTDDALAHECERAIRNYDPCISCATHFLRLTVEGR